MKQLVDEMQSGFIKDRSIIENFATAIEMVQCGNRLKRPIIILKLDFHKAFDSVHWEAITATLKARNFPEHWIYGSSSNKWPSGENSKLRKETDKAIHCPPTSTSW
jgi:hypothetical protein